GPGKAGRLGTAAAAAQSFFNRGLRGLRRLRGSPPGGAATRRLQWNTERRGLTRKTRTPSALSASFRELRVQIERLRLRGGRLSSHPRNPRNPRFRGPAPPRPQGRGLSRRPEHGGQAGEVGGLDLADDLEAEALV